MRLSGFSHLSACAAIVFLFFGIAYVSSLTFVYVEGDDATSIAYHAAGRIPYLQQPYSPYQSLMDTTLSFLPSREGLVRTVAMALTSLAAPVLIILMLALAFEWAPGLIRIPGWGATLVFLLLAPEFLYLGLVYTPALVALCFVLASHLVLRRNQGAAGIIGSILLFGIGAAFRWDTLAYGGLIATDLLVPGKDGPAFRKRLPLVLVWGAGALAAWLVVVRFTGYGLVEVFRQIRRGPLESYPGLSVLVANLQPAVTPALCLLAGVGFFIALRHRNRLALMVPVGLALVARILPYGVPKWMLIAMPCLLACGLIGFSAVWQAPASRPLRLVLRSGILIAILLPWFVSVRAENSTAYGPSFEIQSFDRAVNTRFRPRLAFGSGMAIPTPEGPRALGGHAWVLFGGDWRGLVRKIDGERNIAIERAIDLGVPLLQDSGEGLIATHLMGMGFKTADPWNRIIGQKLLVERRYYSNDHRTVRVLRVLQPKSLSSLNDLKLLRQVAASDSVVICVEYTSVLRQCYLKAPGALRELGATVAILDLDRLIRASERTTASSTAARSAVRPTAEDNYDSPHSSY